MRRITENADIGAGEIIQHVRCYLHIAALSCIPYGAKIMPRVIFDQRRISKNNSWASPGMTSKPEQKKMQIKTGSKVYINYKVLSIEGEVRGHKKWMKRWEIKEN